MKALRLLLLLAAVPLLAADESPKRITIDAAPLGDAAGGVVVRVTTSLTIPADIPAEAPLELHLAFSRGTAVVRTVRRELVPAERSGYSTIVTLPAGAIEIEARLLLPRAEGMPIVLGKESVTVTVAPTGEPFVADEGGTADAIVAEGVVPEIAGAVRIVAPRRDLSPNLFIVDVEVKPPVRRVEFHVDGEKVMTRNAPPWRAELKLGTIPRRVEVSVVGLDAAGRYVDSDAWIVNERDSPLEVKITKNAAGTTTHVRVSVQNHRAASLRTVELWAGERKLASWSRPPYALDVPTASLTGSSFLRASAITVDGEEAADLVYLDGSRYTEVVDVNYVELPVTVVDARGAAITDLRQSEFEILEEGKAKPVANFGFATNLPLSIGVLVDHSGSMRERIDVARQAALAFFSDVMGPKDQAFFGGFSWDATKISGFETSLAALGVQVGQMPPAEGGTALYDAIVSGLYRFRSVPGRRALIVVTDGEDTVSRVPYDEMLEYVRSARVPIYFIGIGISRLSSGRIRGLAAETGGIAYTIGSVAELKATYEELEKELRSQYLIGYYTDSSKSDTAYRKVEVRTTRGGAKVRTIRGFIP
jgi:VWFA-related protein